MLNIRNIPVSSTHLSNNLYTVFTFRCLAVVDNKVEKLYGEAIQAYFDQHNIELKKLIFSGNETDKHISVVEKILVALKKNRASRNQPVLVVGGGVIADVTGCATALYHRNTPYVMVCTSVVTGIDAGPSPRRGCDGFGFKNLFGAYHPPVITFTDRSFFKTLHRGWVRHGIAEIIKMAVIRDESLFRLVEQNSSDLLWTKFGTEMAEFDGDHEAFGKLCDLVIGKSLEGLVLFLKNYRPIFFNNKGLNKLQKPWTKILLVVNVGSLEKRSNQPKYKESRTRSPKTTAKLI